MERITEPSLRFHEANQWAINSEEAFLAALNACAIKTQQLSTVQWLTPEAFGAWIKRLQGQRTGIDNVVTLLSLSLIDLSHIALFFIDLYGAYLVEANLKGAHFYGANLEKAYLVEANLKGAQLGRVNLEGANLEGANLKGAYLGGAYLGGTNLKGANLEGANLKRAYLVEANLEGANLEKINWTINNSWNDIKGLDKAFNVPEALKKQLENRHSNLTNNDEQTEKDSEDNLR